MKKTLKIIFILFFAFVFPNCKDETRPQLFIDQKTKDYVVFKTGSWWVYEEQKSKELDTISVNSFKMEMESFETLTQFDFEFIDMGLFWSSYSVNYPSHLTRIMINADYSNAQNIGKIVEQFPWIVTGSVVFHPFDTVGKYLKLDDTIKFEKFYDSLIVKDKTFYDVMEISSRPDHPKDMKSIWWAKNIGRIKWENVEGEVWELSNFHVIQ